MAKPPPRLEELGQRWLISTVFRDAPGEFAAAMENVRRLPSALGRDVNDAVHIVPKKIAQTAEESKQPLKEAWERVHQVYVSAPDTELMVVECAPNQAAPKIIP